MIDDLTIWFAALETVLLAGLVAVCWSPFGFSKQTSIRGRK